MPLTAASARSPYRLLTTSVAVCVLSVCLPAGAGAADISPGNRALAVWSASSLLQRNWLIVVAAVLCLAQLLLVGALMAHRSRRRQAELALRQSKARNAALLRAIPDLMFVIRADGVYLDYRARDPTQLFLPPEQFLGRHIADVMPPPLGAMFARELAAARTSAEPRVVEYELPMEGETRHYESRLVACDDDTVVSIVRDITERKRTASALSDREIELRQTVERNRHLAGRLIAAQEGERHRIARELHDDLSQKLAMLSIDLAQLQLSGANPHFDAAAQVAQIAERTNEIASGVHRLSHRLHPARLQAIGLVPTLEALCRDTSRQWGTPVDFEHAGVRDPFDPDLALCLYRVTQEALHNVVRHSGATHAAVRLRGSADQVSLEIVDNGSGFALRDREGTGLGLVSMRERVTFLGGTLAIETAPGSGTHINVTARRIMAASRALPHAAGSA